MRTNRVYESERMNDDKKKFSLVEINHKRETFKRVTFFRHLNGWMDG